MKKGPLDALWRRRCNPDVGYVGVAGLEFNEPLQSSALALITDQSIGATVRVVVENLPARIRSQQYAADERLPSERMLAGELGVARNTIREALDVLENHAFIRRRAGSGSFVIGQSDAEKPVGDMPGGVAADTSPLDLLVMRGNHRARHDAARDHQHVAARDRWLSATLPAMEVSAGG